MTLYEHYSPEKYPKYDNYNAINIDKTAEIPCDYNGIMGVPITFLDKYNPDQFEIVDVLSPLLNGNNTYKRLMIIKKGVVPEYSARQIKMCDSKFMPVRCNYSATSDNCVVE